MRSHPRRARRWLAAVAGLVGTLLAPSSPAAQITVGAGSRLSLGGGTVHAGCASLSVPGVLDVGSGTLDGTGDLSIPPSGTVNGQFGSLELAGSWSRQGAFNPGTGTVSLVDGCGLTSATIAGSTSFATLRVTTSSGKQVLFTAGDTFTVTTLLDLQGSPAQRLAIRSTSPGSAAFLNPTGSLQVSGIDVSDNHLTGPSSPFAGPAASYQSIKGTNSTGWFELFGEATAIPALGPLGLLLLALSLTAVGLNLLRRVARVAG